jgi:CubicO group peptidase (beta-lactamase class C family)
VKRSKEAYSRRATFILLFFIALNVSRSQAQVHGAPSSEYPGKHWKQVAKPEDRGWSTEKLAAAKAYADSLDTAAVIVVDDGVIVSQWGATTTKFNVHSIRKSLLSALYGIAIAKGQIKLNATLDQLGIDDNEPSLTLEEKQARVVDLLKARSGIYHAALYETPAMKAEKPARGSHPPRTFWCYNNWDFNALGTIYEKLEQILKIILVISISLVCDFGVANLGGDEREPKIRTTLAHLPSHL